MPEPSPKVIMRSLRLASVAGLFGIISVSLALYIFVTQAEAERAKICDIVETAMIGNADALVIATSPDPNVDRTPEEIARREQIVEQYMNQLMDTLEGCN